MRSATPYRCVLIVVASSGVHTTSAAPPDGVDTWLLQQQHQESALAKSAYAGSAFAGSPQEPCEDWVEFNGTVVRSNLGGMGPDFEQGQELRFLKVGSLGASRVPFDLVFQNMTRYSPQNSAFNRASGSLARLNLYIGSLVQLQGSFVRTGSSELVGPRLAKLTFCDVDHSRSGQEEQLVLRGVSAFYVAEDEPEFRYILHRKDLAGDLDVLSGVEEVVPTKVAGRKARRFTAPDGGRFGVMVTSTMFGQACDDPTDPNALANVTCPRSTSRTVDQARRCFMVEFQSTPSFSLLARIPGDGGQASWSRNFVMSGTSRYFAPSASRGCDDEPAAAGPRPAAALERRGGRGQVGAKGDPHLVNMHGQRFDLLRPGAHVLLNIPRWNERRRQTLLRVDADVVQAGDACADMYFKSLNVTGHWVRSGGQGQDSLHFRVGEGGLPGSNLRTGWMKFGEVELRVVNGHTRQNVEYLNFIAKNLHRSGQEVGGLLGEDDHTAAATPSGACRRVVDI